MAANTQHPIQITLRWLTSLGIMQERNDAVALAERKITLHPLCGWRFVVAALTGLTAIIVGYRYQNTAWVTAILGVGALAIAYVEWVLTRRETSLDRFYEKLAFANSRRNAMEGDARMSALDAYIFSELDNLEYVIERYRFGYMSPSLALRAVRTFEDRLRHQWFLERVCILLEPTGDRCGYCRYTCDTFDHLVQKLSCH